MRGIFSPPPPPPPHPQAIFGVGGGGAEGRNMTKMLTIWQLTMHCCHHSVTVSLSSSPVYSESSTHPLSSASTLCSLSPTIKSLSPALWKSNISLTNHCVLAGWEFSPFIWNQAPIHRPTLQLCAHCHHPLKVSVRRFRRVIFHWLTLVLGWLRVLSLHWEEVHSFLNGFSSAALSKTAKVEFTNRAPCSKGGVSRTARNEGFVFSE